MIDAPYVLRRDEHGVRTLTLNRGAQYNALSREMMSALQTELDAAAADPSVRVLVIAGDGKAFCAGQDLKELRSDERKEFQQALFRQSGKLMTAIVRQPQPVIARVHGIATAAGCQLVASCDLAVAADVAKFAVSGINLGLFCATPAVALGRNMVRKQAFEMLVTGDFVDALEAQRRGLVNRVVPLDALDAEVARLAGAIAAKSPVAVRMGKQLFYQQLEMGVDAAYQVAAETMACNMLSADAKEGIDAFIEKRPPVFRGE